MINNLSPFDNNSHVIYHSLCNFEILKVGLPKYCLYVLSIYCVLVFLQQII